MGLEKASDVNPCLYRLEREGKLRREAEPDGTRPRWFIAARGNSHATPEKSSTPCSDDSRDPQTEPEPCLAERVARVPEDLELGERVLAFVRRAPGASTSDIARASGAPSERATNAWLYHYKRTGVLRKLCETDGSRPRWFPASRDDEVEADPEDAEAWDAMRPRMMRDVITPEDESFSSEDEDV